MTTSKNLDLNKLLPNSLKDGNEILPGLVSNLFNNFLSEEQSISINGRIGKPADGDPMITQSSLERELNAIVPAFYYKVGTQQKINTFADLVNKMQVLNVDVDSMRDWMKEQTYNLSLPIDYDKFVNFTNYFWVGQVLKNKPTLDWNKTRLPEYYVIERPSSTDLVKLPVKVATTRHVNLYANDRKPEIFTITFNSDTSFSITSNQGTVFASTNTLVNTVPETLTKVEISIPDSASSGVDDADSLPDKLCSFYIVNGTQTFSAGDKITIDITYFTSKIFINVISNNLVGKGTVTGVNTISPLMRIDGVQLTGGERILVKNQINPAENGIYTVLVGEKWTRTTDADRDTELVIGSKIYVDAGLTNGGKTFSVSGKVPLTSVDGSLTSNLTFSDLGTIPKEINNWQEFNYWYHRDDIQALKDSGYITADPLQANRPIIEYSNKIRMNEFVNADGLPDSQGNRILQVKTRFNQLPQFDLFRYDGTHLNATSSIFYYVEDPDFSFDSVLLKRVKTTLNSDYVFGIGLKDAEGRLVYYKLNNQLQGPWTAGPVAPIHSQVKFTGGINKGQLFVDSISPLADNQKWTIKVLSPTNFSVYGSRSGNVGNATANVQFSCDDLKLTIIPGTNAFEPGETFTFSVHSTLSPRYVKKQPDGSIINYPGGPSNDNSDGVQDGAWLTPLRLFQNIERENRSEVAFADLMEHMRSVIRNQDGFEGTSFGLNNVRTLNMDKGLGGQIREFDSNFPLLVSMLLEENISPVSILDFAENQYQVALSSIDQFILDDLLNYFTNEEIISLTDINATHNGILKLLNYFEQSRASDANLKTVFSDSTAKVKNWPITLPMMGIIPKVIPGEEFDGDFGINIIRHHDGHISPKASRDVEFERNLVKTQVKRSDGTTTTGIFSETMPANPYSKQLWMKSSTLELKVFDVKYDSDAAPVGANIGDLWFKRSTNTLYEFVSGAWIVSSHAVSSRWVSLNIENIRNSLLIAVENKLYDSVHPFQQIVIDLNAAVNSVKAKDELAKYAAKYNYDTFAPDYSPTNAFTWNYKNANISGLSSVPARWSDVLKKHFDIPGVCLPTSRPDIEPWKLMNHSTKPVNWDSLYASSVSGRLWTDAMWADIAAYFISKGMPGFKLSVNTTTDTLLPPYVNASSSGGADALTNSLFAGADEPYEFGENGPVESLWKKSLEYNYGLARAMFRISPLRFLDKTWGDQYIKVGNNLRVERNTQTTIPNTKFLLHGEKLNLINELSLADIQKRIKINTGGFIHWANKATLDFITSYRDETTTTMSVLVNNNLIGYINVGEEFDIPLTDGIELNNITILDKGIPFSMGEKLTITFYDDIVDPSYVPPVIPNIDLGCEGCVSPGQVDIVNIPMVKVPYTLSHTPARVKRFNGLCQVFTNLLRYNFIDSSASTASAAFRKWETKLAHRFGSLIKEDTLIAKTTLGKLPTTSYSVVLKQGKNTSSKWLSAIRVQLVQVGSKTLNEFEEFIPTGDGANWVFRIETYNSNHPEIEYYKLNTTSDFVTFKALSGQRTNLDWKQFTNHISIEKINTPFVVKGIQNVVNILFGYVQRLQDLGWKKSDNEVSVVDEETGRNLDWQLEIEKFIDRAYSGLKAGEGHILNPFMQKVTLQTPIGILSKFSDSNFIDANLSQSAYDATGAVIPVSDLFVNRTDNEATIHSNTPLFSLHVFIDEYEHTMLINKKISSEDQSSSIFDPYLGVKLDTAYLMYDRNDAGERKPTFDGFFLSGDTVKRNIAGSVTNIGNYYDSNLTFSDPLTSKHALALLGFSKKDYFDNINVTDATQFNFWRGLIQSKGTNMTVDAFVNYKKFADASVDEYWAYKLAEYGDSREKSFPEIKINPSDVTQKYARLQFYSSDSTLDALPQFTLIENSDDSRWYSLDDLGKGLKFEADAITEIVTVSGTEFPQYIRTRNIYHNDTGLNASVSGPSGAEMITSNLLKVTQPGDYVINGFTWINPSKLSPIKLFDYSENTLVEEIGLWHPAIGIHAFAPLEIINIIDNKDPAHYTYTTQTTNNPNYKHLKQWAEREVGKVWWDTDNLSYIPYYDAKIFPNRESRHSRWGSLAEWASVDIYEWVSSDVHPSKYDALAVEQEGNSEIDKSVRASGKAAKKKYYTRNRVIKARPIAWSHAAVGNESAHPAFGPAFFTRVYATSDKLICDSGRTVDVNLINGRHFGGWLNDKPIGEVVIGDDVQFFIGSYDDFSTAKLIPANEYIESMSIDHDDTSLFGTRIGQLTLSALNRNTGVDAVRMSDSTGFYEDVDIADWFSDDIENNKILNIRFEKFALTLSLIRADVGLLTKDVIIEAITNVQNEIIIREAVNYETIIDLPTTIFSNDTLDPIPGIEYGWRTWEIPTQEDLSNDLSSPFNSWKPYVGDQVTINPSSTIVKDMKKDGLTLRNGIMINRYQSSWSNWETLSPVKYEIISNGVDYITFALNETIDSNRLSVYTDGIRVNPSSYGIDGNNIVFANLLKEGTTVTILYRAYQPSSEELEFNPDVDDDFSIQTQYKVDYQYSVLDIRNDEGNITGQKYYFWVQDKTIPSINKSMSLVQAKNILRMGPSAFTLFARLLVDGTSAAFDSCVIAGLGALVGKNNSYKLRFLRNFTLRDDPEEMKLKNTHTEWALIRKQQRSKIPKMLWDLITDAASGADIGGKPLPAQVRIDYDNRNGTRTRFGFKQGQIFADTNLVRNSIINTILNTTLNIKIGSTVIIDYITSLDFDQQEQWFKNAESARQTMNTIWNTARPSQINEIFFAVLEDALANNYEFSDIFKTSLITVSSTTRVSETQQWEQIDEQY